MKFHLSIRWAGKRLIYLHCHCQFHIIQIDCLFLGVVGICFSIVQDIRDVS